MDLEYLEHVKGSPYITEGIWDQFKAKAAQQMGAFGAMAGHQIQDPAETKLRSLWEGFLKSLKSTMKDWETQVSPMLTSNVELDANGQQIKSILDSLARVMIPMDPHKIGKYYDDYNVGGGRTVRNDPNSYSKESAYLTHVPLKSLTPKDQQDYNIEEGFWDAANRDVKLNKALGSNDPAKILNAYKNYILSLFNGFMKDAIKATRLSAQQIYQKLAKIQPSKMGWQATGNMGKIVQNLQKLQRVEDVVVKAPAGAQPPVIKNPSASTQSQPPVSQQADPSTQTSGTQQQSPTTVPQTQGGSGGSGGAGEIGGGDQDEKIQLNPDELSHIILKAIQIIIDAVKEDKGHVGRYFSGEPLPTGFKKSQLSGPKKPTPVTPTQPQSPQSQPQTPSSLFSEVVNEDDNDQNIQSKEEEEEDEPEYPGEFIYNFRSRFRKFPGQAFSIEVRPAKGDPTVKVSEGNVFTVKVWWRCEVHHNNIWVVAYKNGKDTGPIHLMRFFDHEVNSNVGATTPGHANFFSIEKIVKATNPNAPSKLQGISPNVMEAIKQKENELLRALMVVTARKSKEFKSKPKGKVSLNSFNEDGSVNGTKFDVDKATKKTTSTPFKLSPEEIKEKLSGPDAGWWEQALNSIDYFETFEKPEIEAKSPVTIQVQTKLEQEGIDEKTAGSLVSKAWNTLRKYLVDHPELLTFDLLYKASKKSKIPEDALSTSIYVANSAMLYVVKTSDEAEKYVIEAWRELLKNYGLEKIQSFEGDVKKSKEFGDELFNLAVAKSKAKPGGTSSGPSNDEPPLSSSGGGGGGGGGKPPVSGPAGGAAPSGKVTAPVSKPASGPASTKKPTAPVSKASGITPGQTEFDFKPKAATTPSTGASTSASKPSYDDNYDDAGKKGYKQKFWVDDEGGLMYLNKKGEEKPISKKNAVLLSKKYKEVDVALKKSGIDVEKLKESFEIDERAVNPFQLSNFL